MFSIDKELRIISIDYDYLKALHSADEEVHFDAIGYENKKFVGVLVSEGSQKYVIPLSSAKERHKRYRREGSTYLLIFEDRPVGHMREDSIYIATDRVNERGEAIVSHVLSILDIKKMIPVFDGVYHFEDLKEKEDDDEAILKYKKLMKKELSFCIRKKKKIINKASRIYNYQKRTGKVLFKHCDFVLLEEAAKKYEEELKKKKTE